MNDSIRTQLAKVDARESMVRLVADSLPALIAYYEVDSLKCLFANQRYAQYNGWTPQTILDKTVREVIGDAAYAVIEPYVLEAMAARGSLYTREQTLPDGSKRHIEVNLVPHLTEDGRLLGTFVLINDITEHWRNAQSLRQSEERLSKFVQATNEGIIFHKDRRIYDINDALLRLAGYAREEVVGHTTMEFMPERVQEAMRAQFESGGEEPYESVLIHKDGREVPLECVAKKLQIGSETHHLLVVRDMSMQHQAQARIEYLAMHDTLTNLPNRIYLRERMDSILSLARRNDRRVAVLFLDLDHFKTVNDSLGHHIGDLLLREIASLIQATVRDSDVVSRLGGDEFVVVLSEIMSTADAAMVAQKLLESIAHDIVLEGHKLNVSPSIGISFFPADGDSPDELIRHADAAMYSAKGSGRGTYKFFVPAMFHSSKSALDLERQLRDAVARREFVLHYQPLQHASNGTVVGLEALVRWQHPQRGLLGPEEFVGFAESRGLISLIDHWVLRAACRQLKTWHDAGHLKVPVAINLSAMDFRQSDLADEIAGVLLETGLEPCYLDIEITESVLMERDGHILDALASLSKLGVGLVLDDFGTGYSSLAYLKRFPISKLKIDRSFVKDIETDEDDLALVTAIIQMAHGLKLKAVAEGVETLAQLNLLKELGCDEFQGYLVSRPLPVEHLKPFLSA